MFNLSAFEVLGRSATMPLAFPVSYRDEWRDDVMAVAIAQTTIDRYSRDGTSLFQIPSLAKQLHFEASLREKR